ncbi:hypothetical protein DNTS_014047 [Danionella cerebrum]|uniref:C2H2-type domain-containing protein n=1 Tax=Danionella cerebrum TaxID=2873325 RepID=A0A553NIF8_9TELE|nr:hypothetical protein DNTS_014047 [Danionella translucida]
MWSSRMASASATSEDLEDEVEFVSEGPLRPVLEYIDLLSDGDGEDKEEDGASSAANPIEDQVDLQRAQAVSTLDRLAQQVALEKQERAEKCKAFKEKMISQQAHGRRELSISHGDSADAKRCVDIWLKMPGLKPGSISAGSLWRQQRMVPAEARSTPQMCPVINCRRRFDNAALLQGHLKRFDHSPCDPSITLRGVLELGISACVCCGRHFPSEEAWRQHQCLSEGPAVSRSRQTIVCFACPTCCFLFNSREQCNSHMSASRHQRRAISLSDETAPVGPVPVPEFVKKRLLELCKEIRFSVRCTICSQPLTSHMEATAHFNVNCRKGSAIATAEQTVVDVMRKMAIVAHCTTCPKVFYSSEEMEQHRGESSHAVKRVGRLDVALLLYSDSQTRKDPSMPSAKRRCLENLQSQTKRGKPHPPLAWFCECGLRFTEEEEARKHLQSINQIFHKCGVCGKLMGEPSITHLHMSRFHGGAHLSNFLFYCRKCKVEMPRMEDIMAHIGIRHKGHCYYREREDTVTDRHAAKASTSVETEARSVSPPKPESWLCRMCEDLFDSEATVKAHCGDLSSHSFQRFACGHCPQKFFKDSTLRRHCAIEHNGDVALRYYCGLCDSMLFDSEREFQEHYGSLHSQDYYCMEERTNASRTGNTGINTDSTRCPCMASEKSKVEQKAVFTECMKQLAAEKKCKYRCEQCDENTQSYSSMKAHVLLKHQMQGAGKSFHVVCVTCSEVHSNVAMFHSHHHERHCDLNPCSDSRLDRERDAAPATCCTITAEEICPQNNAEEFEDVKRAWSSAVPDGIKGSGDNGDDNTFDQDLKKAMALSLEEARIIETMNKELEEVLKRSMEDF